MNRRPNSLLQRGLIGSVTLLLAATLAGCGDGKKAETKPAEETSATQSVAADPPASPKKGACYPLPFETAVAPTSEIKPVECKAAHTSETVAVGTINSVVDGHLLAVDSEKVQSQVAEACPKALVKYVGGDRERLGLSMIRPVWYTPTVKESDAGADWYRCDAVLLAGTSTLAQLKSSLKGVLDKDDVSDRYAMCGTAAPDAKKFERVQCSSQHTWRAIQVVDFDDGKYPGQKTVRDAGRGQCEDAAAEIADDPLVFEWGYEWPTRDQWEMGQTFGRCWAKD